MMTPAFLLRLALAFAFLYPPVSAVFFPNNWIWFVPDFIGNIMPKFVFMHLFGAAEALIALGILFLKDPRIPAGLACCALAAIIILDWSAFDITFRDVSILLAGMALIALSSGKGRVVG